MLEGSSSRLRLRTIGGKVPSRRLRRTAPVFDPLNLSQPIHWRLGSGCRRSVGGLTARVAVTALQQAIGQRQPPPDVVHHSDRGTQYASAEYAAVLEASLSDATLRFAAGWTKDQLSPSQIDSEYSSSSILGESVRTGNLIGRNRMRQAGSDGGNGHENIMRRRDVLFASASLVAGAGSAGARVKAAPGPFIETGDGAQQDSRRPWQLIPLRATG